MPLYDTLGENAIEYILGHSEASVVVVAADKIGNLGRALATSKQHVQTVVYWGSAADGPVAVRILDMVSIAGQTRIEMFLFVGGQHWPQSQSFATD